MKPGPRSWLSRANPDVDAASLGELAGMLPAGRVVTDPDLVEGYRRDQAHPVEPGMPRGVVSPRSTAEVATVLRWADGHGVPVVPRGAGTGLAGGATATDGAVILSLARMTTIVELSADDQVAVVEPGVITADLDRAAAAVGLLYAPDPSSWEISTIGGNIATNAGGLRCVAYGVTRESVLGLEVVLADGRVLRTGRRTMKGVAGYDLTALFVGSEGTLGVITGATLRLRPRPRRSVTVAAAFPSLVGAAEAVAAVLRAGVSPSLLELLDRTTLQAIEDWKHLGIGAQAAAMLVAQADGRGADEAAAEMAREFARCGAEPVMVSTDPAEAAQLLAIRRLAYPATERLGRCLVEDVGVPLSRLPEMIRRIEAAGARHGIVIATVAHAGDGNLHPVFVFAPEDGRPGGVPEAVWSAADEVFRAALDLGGTLTGEHGVGSLKRRWIGEELGAESVSVHQAIKAALDPRGTLNPGKAF